MEGIVRRHLESYWPAYLSLVLCAGIVAMVAACNVNTRTKVKMSVAQALSKSETALSELRTAEQALYERGHRSDREHQRFLLTLLTAQERLSAVAQVAYDWVPNDPIPVEVLIYLRFIQQPPDEFQFKGQTGPPEPTLAAAVDAAVDAGASLRRVFETVR